jgi:hypothetical protein
MINEMNSRLKDELVKTTSVSNKSFTRVAQYIESQLVINETGVVKNHILEQ